jgi:DNA polymerase-3 subunit chi
VATSTIFFIELNVQNKFRHTCDIIENFYEKNIPTSVYVNDSKNASNLDRQLWVWKQESFIPHIVLNEFTDPPDESVIITTSTTFPVISETLVLFDPYFSDSFNQYKYIIDFAEVYHPKKLQLSRERFKQLKNLGYNNLQFFKLGTFLKNFTA